jgi:hypothetical protein
METRQTLLERLDATVTLLRAVYQTLPDSNVMVSEL